ncbi:zinc-binding dehydrogenase [Nonomuraea sp. NPDC049480]|uniref:zinc-binding dehydrogenase n=1 Tax=Nonomuraea sp. NPDC049480 TaxID=3364353 RepID=UPI0037A81995
MLQGRSPWQPKPQSRDGRGRTGPIALFSRSWLDRRRAYFYNVWAGRGLAKGRFRARLRADLTEVFPALQRGDVTAQIATQLPLARVADALRLAESGTVAGKVVLNP